MTDQKDEPTELDLVYDDLWRAKARIETLEKTLWAAALQLENTGNGRLMVARFIRAAIPAPALPSQTQNAEALRQHDPMRR